MLAPDLPGFGRSDKPAIEYDLDFYTSFLKKFLEHQGLDSVVLCGLSMGGMLSTSVTLRFPEVVRALVLVDAAGLEQRIRWGLTAWLGSRIPGLHNVLSRSAASLPLLLKQLLRNLIHRPERLTDEMVAEIMTAIREPRAGRAWESFLRNEAQWGGFRRHFADRLSEIKVPTLLIHGAEDRIVPLGQSLAAHRRIEGSELEVFEGCGHWLPREEPERLHRVLLRFLDGIRV